MFGINYDTRVVLVIEYGKVRANASLGKLPQNVLSVSGIALNGKNSGKSGYQLAELKEEEGFVSC